MATVTGTLTVNAAFLQEIKDDNVQLNQLLGDLRDISSAAPVLCNHATQFVALLGELRDQLAFHFALEEAYGYFEDAIDIAPRLVDRANQLRAQHSTLFETICELSDAAACLAASPSFQSIISLGATFSEFDEQLRQHETEENQLILEAFGQDIGVGD
jgi:hypothetical protein